MVAWAPNQTIGPWTRVGSTNQWVPAVSTTPKKLSQSTESTVDDFTQEVHGKTIPIVIGKAPVVGVIVYGSEVIIRTIYSGELDPADAVGGANGGGAGGGTGTIGDDVVVPPPEPDGPVEYISFNLYHIGWDVPTGATEFGNTCSGATETAEGLPNDFSRYVTGAERNVSGREPQTVRYYHDGGWHSSTDEGIASISDADYAEETRAFGYQEWTTGGWSHYLTSGNDGTDTGIGVPAYTGKGPTNYLQSLAATFEARGTKFTGSPECKWHPSGVGQAEYSDVTLDQVMDTINVDVTTVSASLGGVSFLPVGMSVMISATDPGARVDVSVLLQRVP